MKELMIKEPEVVFEKATLKYDFKELDAGIAEIEKRYQNIKLKEDDIKFAKEKMADLNKVKTALSKRKTEIKNIINKDYDDFDVAIKDRIAKINTIRANLDTQVNAFIELEKENKKNDIKKYFESLENKLNVPFEHFFEPWMTNKACSMKKWKDAIKQNLDEINDGYETLKNMCVHYPDMLIDMYKQTYDVTKAIAEYNKKELTLNNYQATVKPVEETPIVEKQKESNEDWLDSLTVNFNESIPNVTKLIKVSGSQTKVQEAITYLKSLGLEIEVQ